MVDDYTAKMTELIELMRLIGNDTQQCEVKECKRKISSTITDTLSAFSNGSGGWIILGLSEKEGFTPVEGFNARSMQEALSQACEKMTPVVRPVIVTCPFEGANLVFARINEMLPRDKPCFTTALGPHGGSFIRTGDGDRRMTAYEVDRLIEEHLQPTYDLDIVPGATRDDLDPALVEGMLRRVREQHPRVFAGRSDTDVLLDLDVLRHDDSDVPVSGVGGVLRPTLAGLLALGRYPQKFFPRLSIAIAVFPGTRHDDVFRGDESLVASRTVVGSIPVMIDDAVDSLMRWIGAKKPDYPPIVLREAIANALTHRDYSPDARGTQVRITVFTDRIEITNPGGLFGTVTHDVLANPHPVTGVPFVSTRNQFLFTLLESTPYPGGGFVNPSGGDGYQRIAASLREAGIEPATTRNTINTFTMTITKRRTANLGSPADVSRAIMTVLERHSAMSIKEIIRELHLTPLAATSGMRELIREGRVTRVRFRDDPDQRYRLKGN
ncbi:putative DNA binding domain-containing protein [Bifidobacterium sp. MA2]|uniref:DNA binding domain-containing protein n=1 Tax=Bifidobacterium santillanense TaxID=2809028 RepID=A0ABS5ULT9_9BIFI|nr:ATP-binding protein [Bifidobacterium santillanense]MBT1171871.1 putative DNA binding domain-containing protein [Bifidobacterium santillanense]